MVRSNSYVRKHVCTLWTGTWTATCTHHRPRNFAPIYTFLEVTWPFLVTSPHSSIGKIGLFQSRKIKHRHSKTSQYYIFKEIYLYNQTSIYKFHKLKLETAAVRVNLHSLMVRFSFMRDCGSIRHGDSTASTFSSNFSTITSSKSTSRRRSYV